MSEMIEQEREQAAAFLSTLYHESGHAVVGEVLGWTVTSIEVRETADGGVAGMAYFEQDAADGSEIAAVMSMAGAAAVAVARQRMMVRARRARWDDSVAAPEIGVTWPVASPEDLSYVRRYLARHYFGGATARSEVGRIERYAGELVEEHWEKVVAVALALNDTADADAAGLQFCRLGRSGFLKAMGKG